MLNKELIKSRYLAAHLWCDVKHPLNPLSCRLFGINVDSIQIAIKKSKEDVLEFHNVSDCQLLLHPLSAITDEDVAVFGKMFYPIGWDKNTEEVQGFKNYLDSGGLYFAIHECVCPSHDIWLLIYDTLRSRGYYTGQFMGFDPIAEGWCIIKDNNV